MIAAALAALWFGAVANVAQAHRAALPRSAISRLRAAGAMASAGASAVAFPSGSGRSPAGVVGGALRRVLRRPDDPRASRRAGRVALLALALAAISPPASALLVAIACARSVQRTRRDRLADERRVVDELPEVVDLLVLAVGSGLNVALAVGALARRGPPVVGAALRDVVRRAAIGERLADALDGLPARLGEPVRPVVAALTAAERYGVPLLPSLERLATEVRLDRRRRAEEAARRVPVKLLFPLVLCTLPAFALLTVVPLLVGAARSVRL